MPDHPVSEHPLKQSLVRIRSDRGVAGCGFLVSPRRVLTCAHVVDQAETPDRRVLLDFPFAGAKKTFAAWVVSRQPGHRLTEYPPADGLDVALLHLQEAPPDGTRPARLTLPPGDLWNHPFRAFGFPAGRDGGVYAVGVLRDTQASGWAQLDASRESSGYFVAPGFSGTPVWDEPLNAVVGMVVAADQQTGVKAAYMIPTAMLLGASAELAADVGREILARNTCLLIKPRVGHAEGREQQRDDIENLVLPALEQAGLRLPDEHPAGVEVHDISPELIQVLDEAGIVVIDANCYERDVPFPLSPYLFYFMALAHTKGSSTILVSRSSNHLPVCLQGRPHTLTYATNRVREFDRAFRAAVQKIQARADEKPDNPVQEYVRMRALEVELYRTRAALEATNNAWKTFLSSRMKDQRPEEVEEDRAPTPKPAPEKIVFKPIKRNSP
ncbi:MAG TPA: serine protease [Gemmataceae bacterium]|nr:serine protease [Gemmataceae bacterium]